ncbi:MAG: hypothetical protein LBV80_00710 [Deltaproteobacteria bacterium]|nr:hypothetical protein [Deltaproteobacteria bacterium]
MRVYKLLLELQAFLETSLAAFPLPEPVNGKDKMDSARCFLGNVPDDNEKNLPERFPFVVIRWVEGSSQDQGDNLEQVALLLGVYSPSGPGEAELLTAMLMDHLRGDFMRNRLLADIFDLQLPLESAKPDPEKKQHNYHIATMITRWRHTSPRRSIKGDFYGEQ